MIVFQRGCPVISCRWLFSFCIFLAFFLATVCAGSGESIHQSPEYLSSSAQDAKKTDVNHTGVVFEEPLVNGKSPVVSLPEPDDCLEPTDRNDLPKVAIIIDDMGHHKKMGGELLDLDLNLTFSFLPHAPFTVEQEERAWKMGRDILVHMPMEPKDTSFDPGPGSLNIKDSTELIAKTVARNLDGVPHAIGMNNHMGSRFTEDREAMHEVLKVLQKKGLFYVDSLTTPQSAGADEARKMGLKTGSRIVFLDNSQTQEDICRQLKRLVAYAKKHGSGIGIGHPNRATINALKECRDLLLKQVMIVGVQKLVK